MKVGISGLFVVVAGFAAAGCNNNHVLGVSSGALVAQPNHIEFERVRLQDDFGQVVMLKNQGTGPVTVTGLEVDPPNAALILNVSAPTAASPWVIDAAAFHAVDIHFIPQVQGDVAANLLVHSNDPANPLITVPLNGHGFFTATDSYSQGAAIGGKADILFVVDDSGSMSDKQTKVGNGFSTFINWLTTKNVDYHISITTTDMDAPTAQGRFRGTPKVIDNTTPDVINTFKTSVNVGTSGSGNEQGLAAAGAALSPALLASDNAGFIRDDAKLFVVYVSDEEDSSPGTVASYISGAQAVKGGDASKVFFGAIAGPPPYGCFTFAESADAGTRYKDITSQTTGLFGSICDTDFGTTLQNLAFQVTAVQGTFVLTNAPDVATIKVFVNGVEAPQGHWVYDAGTNSISFVDPWIPAGGVPVTITYDVL